MNINELEKNFYLEITDAINELSSEAVKKMSDKNTDLSLDTHKQHYEMLQNVNLTPAQLRAMEEILKWTAYGVVHSLFASIDGDTALSNDGKALQIVDFNSGEPITEGALHENFFKVALDK